LRALLEESTEILSTGGSPLGDGPAYGLDDWRG
jgi:hypothetical protein